jgi:hypothetical protein
MIQESSGIFFSDDAKADFHTLIIAVPRIINLDGIPTLVVLDCWSSHRFPPS